MRRDFKSLGLLSLSARRAWIEISGGYGCAYLYLVALRKESVDRNSLRLPTWAATVVALRKESVDRNIFGVQASGYNALSLSARRAWIEIKSRMQLLRILSRRSPQGERG